MTAPNRAPEAGLVRAVAGRFLNGVTGVERVSKGWSTYVYRIAAGSGTYYLRFLPEDASFAAEALAHRILLDKGVSVPRVLGFERKDRATGLSIMLTAEMPGVSMDDGWPGDGAADILREAGRQIALVHEVPVDGFGWIDRTSHDMLKGVKPTFQDYFGEFLYADLKALERYEFTDGERARIADLMEEGRRLLDVRDAVLVHGDFDISHIFHSGGRYTGLIDFGEIRGNSRLFDLATFTLFDGPPDRTAYSRLFEGYREVAPLSSEDLYAVEIMGLSIAVRFLGKKVDDGPPEFWVRLARKQLYRVAHAAG